MVGVMKDISILDHSKYQALVVCILSHGGEDFIFRKDDQQPGTSQRQPVQREGDRQIQGNFVYGVDDNVVPIRCLTMYFKSSKCKTLANKPKLFFIQACQGENMETGMYLFFYYLCSGCLYSFYRGSCFIIPPLPEGGGGILFYLCLSVRPSFRPSKIFFVAFFSVTVDGRNLIFGHKLHIGMPYCGKRFWTRQIPTSCLPT